jgi:hypothetical protein
MIRTIAAVLALAVPLVATAEELYIVPGYVVPAFGRPSWSSTLVISSPLTVSVNARVAGVFPNPGVTCSSVSTFTIQRRSVELRPDCTPGGMATVVIATDRPLSVTVDAKYLGAQVGSTVFAETFRQQIEPGRAWLAPNRDHFIPEVTDVRARANLLLVNPNDEPLLVEWVALSDNPNARRHSAVVLPRSSALVHLSDLDIIVARGDILFNGVPTMLQIRGDRTFFAAVSMLTGTGGNYRLPITPE